MKACDVCHGTPGRYPVINRYGRQLYEIRCPECGGSGEVDDPAHNRRATDPVISQPSNG